MVHSVINACIRDLCTIIDLPAGVWHLQLDVGSVVCWYKWGPMMAFWGRNDNNSRPQHPTGCWVVDAGVSLGMGQTYMAPTPSISYPTAIKFRFSANEASTVKQKQTGWFEPKMTKIANIDFCTLLKSSCWETNLVAFFWVLLSKYAWE